MNPPLSHREKWDNYWRDLSTTVREVLWDIDPTEDVARELPLYADLLDRSLPLVDLGCGHGRQTRYLAGHFKRVIGVDLSGEAIHGARQLHAAPNVEYRILDAAVPAEARALHDAIGDANVHVHGVFHQLPPADRSATAQTVATLAGERGRVFVVELGAAADEMFASLMARGGPPPPKVARVFESGIVPGGLRDGELAELLAPFGLRVLKRGTLQLSSTMQFPDGRTFTVPGEYWLFTRDAATKPRE